MTNHPSLLLVDDDPLISESIAFVLKDAFSMHIASTREEAKRLLYSLPILPDLALVDLGLPPSPHSPDEGFALIPELLVFNRSMKILVLSGQDTLENVSHALSLGAADFIQKPCDMELLKARLEHQLLILKAELSLQERKNDLAQPSESSKKPLIGDSPPMETLRNQIDQFANSPFSVLIQGESGTGKELVATCLHTRSQRTHQPCLTVNCAAFTSELLEAQLFGHAKGAFTGAGSTRSGFFEESGEGTLILDEIGEMPMQLQSKLLRVLENGEYYRIGETKVRYSSARIIASTNRDLREEVQEGRFRADLYHRLSVLNIKVPNVHERGSDKTALLHYFQEFYKDMGTTFTLNDEALIAWNNYSFPGNVRELRNIVVRLGAKYSNQKVNKTQLVDEFETHFISKRSDNMDTNESIAQQLKTGSFSLDDVLLEWEKRYIDSALELTNGNLSQAARKLGINRTTLYSKMQRLNRGNS